MEKLNAGRSDGQSLLQDAEQLNAVLRKTWCLDAA